MIKVKLGISSGFSLVELMIVIAIIGVLAAVAFPSYQESIKKSRRADAKVGIIAFAAAMERHFTENNNYCDAATGGADVANCGTATDTDTGTPSIINPSVPLDGGTAYYNLTISAVTATTFTLLATRTGAATGDECGDFTYTQAGVKGLANNTHSVATCWQ